MFLTFSEWQTLCDVVLHGDAAKFRELTDRMIHPSVWKAVAGDVVLLMAYCPHRMDDNIRNDWL